MEKGDKILIKQYRKRDTIEKKNKGTEREKMRDRYMYVTRGLITSYMYVVIHHMRKNFHLQHS